MPTNFSFSKLIDHFVHDESGATAVEYGLMIAAIAAIIVTVVIGLGANLNDRFTYVESEMGNLP